jgi:crossover junction endodeoxyribonuclease RuvC
VTVTDSSDPYPMPVDVVGLDLSLTATGIADAEGVLHTIKSTGHENDLLSARAARLNQLVDRITYHADAADLVVIEGPSFGQRAQRGTHDRSGLWWLIVGSLHAAPGPVMEVPPANLKTYATGTGNATKDDIRVEILKRYGLDIRDNNQADAFVLRAMGLDLLGHPILRLPQTHRRALDKLTLPTLAGTPA